MVNLYSPSPRQTVFKFLVSPGAPGPVKPISCPLSVRTKSQDISQGLVSYMTSISIQYQLATDTGGFVVGAGVIRRRVGGGDGGGVGFSVGGGVTGALVGTSDGDEVAPIDIVGFNPHPIDLSNPVIINENGLKVTAFRVLHDPVEPALGYRFDYKGRSIVISGDTSYSENLIKNAKDADVLFHEAQANHQLDIMKDALADNKGLVKVLDDIVTYHSTPIEAAQAANLANVDHLMFYHLTPAPRNKVMERMFFRGVNEVRKDWSATEDGTMVVLPLDSNEIKITKVN